MNHILGRFEVDDLEAWKKLIQSHQEAHLKVGMRFQQAWRNVDNPKEIFFLFTAADLDKARAFLKASGALDQDKLARGEIPELFFLENQ
jgi:hypothetical protein